ncbi:heavy metal translocating P-type ATPase [Haliangium sp. UPWRP_2]|uniref:heavy metal translocating P-type ATPase n=1 Tax=Haliangium sp. UPWRP_2 TaxID=1931276 RepID=UPI000D0CDDD7|nr:heavy metal translocating P-type ATPase [Haliangium sp. UPWRP_2]PSM31735.1 hypothetical protein BVG81_003850 [Haliangium sp. UPWRP_2]
MLLAASLLLGGLTVLIGYLGRDAEAAAPADAPAPETQDGAGLIPPSSLPGGPGEGLVTNAVSDLKGALTTGRGFRWAAALGLAAGGVFLFPPLRIAALVPLLWNLAPTLRAALGRLKRGERWASTLVEVGGLLGTLALGYVGLAAITGFMLEVAAWLVAQTEDRSQRRLLGMIEALPEKVWVERDGYELEIPLREACPGDVVVLDAGQLLPIDGTVLSGLGRFDERSLTGESLPVEHGPGSTVRASTVLLQGRVRVRVQGTGEATLSKQLGAILESSRDYRAEIEARGQQIVEQGALPTLGLSAAAYLLAGPTAAVAMTYAGFGYSMRYMAPLAVLGYAEQASHQAVLIKDGRALELLSRVDTVLFDKTGTLTTDALQIERVVPSGALSESQMLSLAASAEYRQRHPIARAIIDAARQRGLPVREPEETALTLGAGLMTTLDGGMVLVGNQRLLREVGIAISPALQALEEACTERGHSVVFVAWNDELVGAIEFSAVLRPEAAAVVSELQRRGLDVAIVSGDQPGPTREVATRLGIATHSASVLPESKAEAVARLQAQGRTVCFVGDGLNDAIALRQADVAISLRGANSLALDSAPIILLDSDLRGLLHALELSRQLNDNLRIGTALSILPGSVAAIGILSGAFGLAAAIAWYNLSLFLGVGNALRPSILPDARPGAQTMGQEAEG